MKNDKLKDMIRSILPSKNREAARQAKAFESRRVRRAIRAEVYRDADEIKADLHREAYQGSNVAWRRGGDKLNHFMRWCESITEGMTTQEALDHVRSLLPRNVIGDHAYQHWEWHRRQSKREWLKDTEWHRRKIQSFVDSTTYRLRRALAFDPALHARLNAEIKRRKPPGDPRRLLQGVHDIEAFVTTIGGPEKWWEHWRDPIGDPRAIERSVTLELIVEVEKIGGRKGRLLFLPPRGAVTLVTIGKPLGTTLAGKTSL